MFFAPDRRLRPGVSHCLQDTEVLYWTDLKESKCAKRRHAVYLGAFLQRSIAAINRQDCRDDSTKKVDKYALYWRCYGCLALEGSSIRSRKIRRDGTLLIHAQQTVGVNDQALEPGRQHLVHGDSCSCLIWTQTVCSQNTTPGDSTVGRNAIQRRGTEYSEYGATYCWRLRPPPWVEAEAIEGLGLTRAETWCQQLLRN
ncbi:hypothetical protein MKX08_003083 [Trichoderma sp. CBMAI-0020]|nr:hypothetical protein MKX08_003083 [Trichoderma sp. CBMAI-0020]